MAIVEALAVAAVRAIGWVRRRVFIVRDRVRSLHAVRDLVADELELNAEVVTFYPQAVSKVRNGIQTSTWEQHKSTLHAISKRDPQLWREITDAYAVLLRTRARGAEPPAQGALLELAERLRRTKY